MSEPTETVAAPFDAILLVSFGGPEGMDDVIPFMENVTRGRGIPRERLEEVSEHYKQFGGVSPINQQCRELKAALDAELAQRGVELPVYWGNRNWHPMLADTMAEMNAAGVTKALALMTSAFSSYSGCRQYREDVQAARTAAGEDASPAFAKIRVFYNHPGFIEPMRDNVAKALEAWPEDERQNVRLVFCTHSIPSSMAYNSRYEAQYYEASRLVADAFPGNAHDCVYQSRSGPPTMPWLEPDVCDHLETLHDSGINDVVLIPIGFISDHMEVLFDLDTEAKQLCEEKGIRMQRAATVGTDPRFVAGLVDLLEERMANDAERGACPRPAMGCHGASHDVCPENCCLPTARPGMPMRLKPTI